MMLCMACRMGSDCTSEDNFAAARALPIRENSRPAADKSRSNRNDRQAEAGILPGGPGNADHRLHIGARRSKVGHHPRIQLLRGAPIGNRFVSVGHNRSAELSGPSCI